MQLGGPPTSRIASTMRYTAIAGMTGMPGLSVPVGLDGLPVGMLLTAKPGRDNVALAGLIGLQTLTEHHLLLPDLGRAFEAVAPLT